MAQWNFAVEKMKCDGCVANVERAIGGVPGVTAARVDLAGKRAEVEGEVDPAAVVRALNAAGYPASLQLNR